MGGDLKEVNEVQEKNESADQLLAIEIQDDELAELLDRLAATDAIFQSPVTRVRDVAELTEAPPSLIARILSEIRGIKDAGEIQRKLDEHTERLRIAESRLNRLESPSAPAPPKQIPTVRHPLWESNAPIPQNPTTKSKSEQTDQEWARYKKRLDTMVYEDDEGLERNRIIATAIVIVAILAFIGLITNVINSPVEAKSNLPPPFDGQIR